VNVPVALFAVPALAAFGTKPNRNAATNAAAKAAMIRDLDSVLRWAVLMVVELIETPLIMEEPPVPPSDMLSTASADQQVGSLGDVRDALGYSDHPD